jgi:hypothetical protein
MEQRNCHLLAIGQVNLFSHLTYSCGPRLAGKLAIRDGVAELAAFGLLERLSCARAEALR